MARAYPPRIQEFRRLIIKDLPKAPNDKPSRAALEAMPTRRLILAFITWRMRLIPAKPREVTLWAGGVTPSELRAAEPRLRPLLEKVEAGEDLTPPLSDLVMVRDGLHHFHVGVVGPGNPKGRSGVLIFAHVLEKEFRIVAISDHNVFEQGSTGQLRFFGISRAYVAKDVPPGQAFMANPVMSSGHSMDVTLFADSCEDQMERLDPQLDNPAFIDKLYNDQSILRDGKPVARPSKPSLAWYFNDLKFGILDRRTKVFFCIYPYFDR